MLLIPARLRAPSSVRRFPPKERVSTELLMCRDLDNSATPLSPIAFLVVREGPSLRRRCSTTCGQSKGGRHPSLLLSPVIGDVSPAAAMGSMSHVFKVSLVFAELYTVQ